MAGAMKDVTKAMVSLNKQVTAKDRDAAQLVCHIHPLPSPLTSLVKVSSYIDLARTDCFSHQHSYAND